MARMKDIANIMTNFKGYNQCVDAFIETSQMVSFSPTYVLLLYFIQ